MSDIFQARPAASPDDCYVAYVNYTWQINVSLINFIVGRYSATSCRKGGGIRFTNVTIPKGATIDAAYIKPIASSSGTVNNVNSKITAEAADDPSTFSTIEDYQARPHTTAEVLWDAIPNFVTDTEYTSPDIKAVIQEVTDREGWQSGNHLVIFWDDHDNRSSQVSSCQRLAYSYNKNPAKAVLLYIEYTVVPIQPEIETLDATNIKSDRADLKAKVIDDLGKTLSVRHNYGKTIAYGMNTPWQEGKHTNDIITQTATDLDPETGYHFRGEAVFED